jgi:hypothetical protein
MKILNSSYLCPRKSYVAYQEEGSNMLSYQGLAPYPGCIKSFALGMKMKWSQQHLPEDSSGDPGQTDIIPSKV